MENPLGSSPTKHNSVPGTPLRQLSAEQVNAQRMPLAQSPSLHSYLNEKESPSHRHHGPRESVSVYEKVAFINSLSNPSSPTRPSSRRAGPTDPPPNTSNAAFQRAVLGYEESQASLASMKAENERLAEQVAGYRKRETKIAERIESLLDQLQTEREERKRDKDAYVAEVKKCRKQAYKAELQTVEAREELKECKSDLRRKEADLESERQKKEDARQESFERAYAVQGLTEEVEVLKQRLKVVEGERDQARSEIRIIGLQKREIDTRVQDFAFQKASSLSSMKAKDESDMTPRPLKRTQLPKEDHRCSKAPSDLRLPIYSDFVAVKMMERQLDGYDFTLEDHILELYKELERATAQHAQQKEHIHIMNMECQFNACSCRDAERRGKRFIHDVAFDEMVEEERAAKRRKVEEDERFRQLPPEPSAEKIPLVETEQIEEAINMPLPSPKAQELESKRSSLEPTSHLEEMTQVIVEPGNREVPFTFSMSVSSRVEDKAEPPQLRQTQSALGHSEVDLFDLSPPKHHPPRPSTSMGVITLGSPVRLVPDSPQFNTIQPRSSTPLCDPPIMSRTTRVALKDTSPQHSIHRRAQSRPNIRTQSRPHSPLSSVKSNPDFQKSTSASPSASTLFPVTPKQPRGRPLLESHSQSYPEQAHTITTTTTVPLRGDDQPSTHNQHDYAYDSHTQPITSLPHLNTALVDIAQPQLHSQDPNQDPDQHLHIPTTPVSREAALAQIRARRDRARSVNLKKTEGLKSAPGSAKRGFKLAANDVNGVGVGVGGRDVLRGETLRDVSVASMVSAPGRFGG